MDSIYGQKLGMTRVFTENGDSIGVTVVKVDPATVVNVKTTEKAGYNAVVLGFGEVRENLLNKPHKGQFKKTETAPKKHLKEVRIDGDELPEIGTVFGADVFQAGQRISVTGISRGHGFQGGVKRHGFAGGPKTHGQSDRLRAPGSIGQASYPARVLKGTRMAGRMGNERVTVKNLKVFSVEPEQSLILIKGVVPGAKNSMILVRKAR